MEVRQQGLTYTFTLSWWGLGTTDNHSPSRTALRLMSILKSGWLWRQKQIPGFFKCAVLPEHEEFLQCSNLKAIKQSLNVRCDSSVSWIKWWLPHRWLEAENNTNIQLPAFFFFFCLFRATPTAYGNSQATGQIGTASCQPTPQPQQHGIRDMLWPTPQLTTTMDP